MQIQVTMNVNQFVRQMLNNEKFLEKKAVQIVERFAVFGRNQAKFFVPVDTGRLRGSIRVYRKSGGLQADIATYNKYAKYVEYGTGIHNANGNGRGTPWLYKNLRRDKYYWTTGQKPKFFMKKAYESMLRNADTILQGVFKWR